MMRRGAPRHALAAAAFGLCAAIASPLAAGDSASHVSISVLRVAPPTFEHSLNAWLVQALAPELERCAQASPALRKPRAQTVVLPYALSRERGVERLDRRADERKTTRKLASCVTGILRNAQIVDPPRDEGVQEAIIIISLRSTWMAPGELIGGM